MKIKEFSQKCGLPATTLRYYESLGILQVHRLKNGLRDFKESDLRYVNFIKRLRDMGMPVKEMQSYALLRYQGEHTAPQRLKILERQQKRLEEKLNSYQGYLDALNEKIDIYQTTLLKK